MSHARITVTVLNTKCLPIIVNNFMGNGKTIDLSLSHAPCRYHDEL